MTSKKADTGPDHLVEALVEDILATSDADILAEFKEDGGDPERLAAEMQEMFRAAQLQANKKRMADAKAGVTAARASSPRPRQPNMAKARMHLHALLTSEAAQGLTLAARKESELSDADVLGMLEDLRDLGLDPDGDQTP